MLRDATQADAEAIALIEVRAWQAAYQRALGPQFLNELSVPLRAAVWASELADADTTTLVDEREGTVIGVSCASVRGEIAAINGTYVDPLHWQAGVGRPLLEASFVRIVDQPWQVAYAWLFLHNAMGRAFFARFGFRLDGGKRTHKPSGAEEVRMRVPRISLVLRQVPHAS